MDINQIKNMAYHEQDSAGLDVVDRMLYLTSEAIYKMFQRGFYDEDTAKKKLAEAVCDYNTLKILSVCFDKNMELQHILEPLKCEYNKTKSRDVAVQIAELVTKP